MLVSNYTQVFSHDDESSAIWHSVFGRPMLVPNILSDHLLNNRSKGLDPEIEQNFGKEVLDTLAEAHIIIDSKEQEQKDIDDLFDRHNPAGANKVKFLSLIMSEECPFRCTYCIHFASSKHYYNEEKMMSVEVAKTSIDQYFDLIARSGQESAYVNFGGGEALLNYKTIAEVLPYIDARSKELGIPVRTALNSNLYLLTEEMAANFIKYGVEIAASLDGSKEGNDKVRLTKNLTGTYDRILENMKIFEKLGRPLKSFAMTVTEANFFDVDTAIIDWAESQGMNEVRIDIDVVGMVDIPIEDVVERLKKVRAYAKAKGIPVIGFWSRAAENLGLVPEEVDVGFCGGERGHSVCVAPSGQVFPCGYSNYQIGTYNNLNSIYQEDAYQELLKRRNLNLLEDCKDCPIYGFCRGGCLITKEANETSEKQKAMCKLYVEMTKAIIDESIDA